MCLCLFFHSAGLCVCASECVRADNSSPIGIQWRELQDLAAPFPRMGSQSRDCARLWRARWNGWVSVFLFLFSPSLHSLFTSPVLVSYISLSASSSVFSTFSLLMGFSFIFLSLAPTHPVHPTPPPVPLHPSLCSSSSIHSSLKYPFSPPFLYIWTEYDSLTSICCFSPHCLFASPLLSLFIFVILLSPSQSLPASFYILSEFWHTEDVWVSFLTQAMNEDAMDVCISERIAISVSVSIIFIVFHVCTV